MNTRTKRLSYGDDYLDYILNDTETEKKEDGDYANMDD